MKTKKIQHVSLMYVISCVVLCFLALSELINVFVVLICLALLIYIGKKHIDKLLLLDFEEYLRLKIQKRDWPEYYLEFPVLDTIHKWILEYQTHITGDLPKILWNNILTNPMNRWQNVLESISIPMIGVERGLNLYDLYKLTSIDPSKVNAGNTTKESQEMAAYIEYLPVKDLICYLKMPLQLTNAVLYHLLIRKDVVGNFNEVCLSLMKSDCEIIAPMDVIELLICENNQKVPVVFPQKFLAYLIKWEVENGFHLKSDPEKRSKIFDWYMSQEVKDFDFFSYWPRLEEEEIKILTKSFRVEATDQIFLKQGLLNHISDQAIKEAYNKHFEAGNTIPYDILSEVRKRFFN